MVVSPVTTGGARVTGRWLAALALAVYLFTAGGSLTSTDAVVAFDVTRNLVEHRTVAMSGNLLGMEAHRGRDGRYYSPFGIAQSLYNVPFYMAANAFVSVTGITAGKPDSIPKAAVSLGQAFLVAAIVWQIFALAAVVTGRIEPSLLAALTFAFGSVLWPYAKFGFNQPLAATTLLAAVMRVVGATTRRERRHLVSAGVWLSVSLLTRHEMIVAAAPIAAWLLFERRADLKAGLVRAAAFFAGVIPGITIWLVFNWWRFGNPFDSGHLRDPVPGFGSPILSGLAGLLFSPSTSLFIYSPVALLGLVGLVVLFGRHREVAVLCLGLIGALLLVYASLGNWIGGRSYGSRYLVVVLPYLAIGWAAWLATMPRRSAQICFAIALSIGIVVQLPGVLVDYAKVSQAASAERGGFTTAERQWSWEASSLALNARALTTAIPDNIAYVTGRREPPAVQPATGDGDRGFSQQFAFSLDFWWLYLFYLGILPRAGIPLLLMLFAATVAICLRQLRRGARS